jgi:hypothetical protein
MHASLPRMTSLMGRPMIVSLKDRTLNVRHYANVSPDTTLALFLKRFFEIFPEVIP